MASHRLLPLLPLLLACAACGDSHEGRGPVDGGSDGAVSIDGGGVDSGSAVDAGEVGEAGQCTSDADCAGGTCVEVAPGIGVCVGTAEEATACSGTPDIDECCDSSECTEGACYLGPVTPYCGGPAMVAHNVCASDLCSSDADCADGVCLPAGAFSRPVRTCLPAGCTSDADCSAEAGGRCVLYYDPCCGSPSLQCRYPGGCRTADDCPSRNCAVRDGKLSCDPMPPACPA